MAKKVKIDFDSEKSADKSKKDAKNHSSDCNGDMMAAWSIIVTSNLADFAWDSIKEIDEDDIETELGKRCCLTNIIIMLKNLMKCHELKRRVAANIDKDNNIIDIIDRITINGAK
jgi:hypothetical protein